MSLVQAICQEQYAFNGTVPLLSFRRSSAGSATRLLSPWLCGGPLDHAVAVDVDGRLYGCVVATRTYLPNPAPVMRPVVEALRMGMIGEPMGDQQQRMRERAAAVGVFTEKGLRYSSYGRCVDCEYYDRCRVCPLAPAFERRWDDPFRVPDFLCAFNKVMFKYRDRFPPQPPQEWVRTRPVRSIAASKRQPGARRTCSPGAR